MSPSMFTWEKHRSVNTISRRCLLHHCTALVGHYIFIVVDNRSVKEVPWTWIQWNCLFKYNHKEKIWSQSLQLARSLGKFSHNNIMFVVDDELWIIATRRLETIQCFDMVLEEPCESPITGHLPYEVTGAVYLDYLKSLLVFSGNFNEVHRLDTRTKSSKRQLCFGDVPSSRTDFSLCSAHHSLFLFGGSNETGMHRMSILSAHFVWSLLQTDTTPPSRKHASLTLCRGELLLLGGYRLSLYEASIKAYSIKNNRWRTIQPIAQTTPFGPSMDNDTGIGLLSTTYGLLSTTCVESLGIFVLGGRGRTVENISLLKRLS